ncbi:TIGR04255 family protein [Tumidithrix elongata RA019]|uniref:TIGR04255 family protein n=1 Tax=Tumidithrix elongata BACA0141 TaxID=2716417 RepID=A0AAW9PTI8_9CYAN|nr:TIGR04255 family protein [Tumidithrix elongata RA019]
MLDIETPFQIQFETPPVVEVACGVAFHELKNLLAPHLGLLWEEFKADYPSCQEKPELEAKIEDLSGYTPKVTEVKFFDTPPLPRIWFLSDKEDKIIQIQRNRFLHNWRKVNQDDQYPRFDKVFQIFKQQLSTFKEFLSKENLGEIQPLQYEIVYVNIISTDIGNQKLAEIGRVFPDIVWRNNQDRFLIEPESINWNTTFLLPENKGRIHINIRTLKQIDNQEQKFLMDITVRGIDPNQSSLEGLSDWFNLAHNWVIQSFTDLTSLEMQNSVWGKKNDN